MFAGLYNNEALALADLKRYEEAEALYKKAISITEKPKTARPTERFLISISRKSTKRSKTQNAYYRLYVQGL